MGDKSEYSQTLSFLDRLLSGIDRRTTKAECILILEDLALWFLFHCSAFLNSRDILLSACLLLPPLFSPLLLTRFPICCARGLTRFKTVLGWGGGSLLIIILFRLVGWQANNQAKQINWKISIKLT